MNIADEWKQSANSIVKSTSPTRENDDHSRIKHIKSLLQHSKLGRQLLNWADQNDISIYLDYQCTSARGYYTVGSKAVCLNNKTSDEDLAHVLAHELRHAWQDQHNLIPTLFTSPIEIAQQIRFAEADAYAHQMVCMWQMSQSIQDYPNLPKNDLLSLSYIDDKCLEQPNTPENGKMLLAFFQAWPLSGRQNIYDNYVLAHCAKHLGVQTAHAISFKSEFTDKIKVNSPDILAAPPCDTKAIYTVGKMLNGENYFRHSEKPVNDLSTLIMSQPLSTVNQAINQKIKELKKHSAVLKPFKFGG